MGRNEFLDKEEFIRLAKERHGDKYDYSNVEYVNSTAKVKIICPIHGEFEQLPYLHLGGSGCRKCSGKGLSQEEIIQRFKTVHGERYDYSKFIFTKMHDKSIITCEKHGDFLLTPAKHMQGRGCQKCAMENRSKNKSI